MTWQQSLVARMVDRIEHHGLLNDLEPYRMQLEFAATENPVDQRAAQSTMYMLWQLWHQGFAAHVGIVDDNTRKRWTTQDITTLTTMLVAALPASAFGAQPPARYAWVIFDAIQRYEIHGETANAP